MNIILGVSGSISAYKAADILRGLIKEGHNVRVILTSGSLKFINKDLFCYLGAKDVYSPDDDFNQNSYQNIERNVLHIDLAHWSDLIIVAPCSANLIANLAQGMANDLLTSTLLSTSKCPLIIYPAMNPNMYHHQLVQSNLNKLKECSNVFIFPPDEGQTLCGDQGLGRLPDVSKILLTAPLLRGHLSKSRRKHIVITAGATISPLDPIRHLTNPATGSLGLEIARQYLEQGDYVTCIVGVNADRRFDDLMDLPHASVIKIQTTDELEIQMSGHFKNFDIYISTAALCDIKFSYSDQKMKKDQLPSAIPITNYPDVLSKVVQEKRPNQIVIGFAAEGHQDQQLFLNKWLKKPVDLLIGNQVYLDQSNQMKGFGNVDQSNLYTIIENGKIKDQLQFNKLELANWIINWTNDRNSLIDQGARGGSYYTQ